MTHAYREKLGSGRLSFRTEKLSILEAQRIYHILLKREAGYCVQPNREGGYCIKPNREEGYCVQLAEQVGMFS